MRRAWAGFWSRFGCVRAERRVCGCVHADDHRVLDRPDFSQLAVEDRGGSGRQPVVRRRGRGDRGDEPDDHAISEFSTGLNSGSIPDGIAAGPDGNLWFTDDGCVHSGGTCAIGEINPTTHAISEFSTGLNPSASRSRSRRGRTGTYGSPSTTSPTLVAACHLPVPALSGRSTRLRTRSVSSRPA